MQPTPTESAAPTSEPVQPPRVLSLPALQLPGAASVPASGVVEVTVLVAADGSATLEACAADSEVCDATRAALAAARFAPASRAGVPLPARVRIALRVADEADADAGVPDEAVATASAEPIVPSPSPSPPPSAATAPAPSEPQRYGAKGRSVQTRQAGMRRLELAEMRDMPGAFGDPFRAVDALPGIVPLLSGLPYFFVRGAPPSGTLYFYDGVPVPTLYHLAIGPAVIHPRMVGPIRLYSGVPPARYGRLTGGAVVAEGPEASTGDTHAEAELRLLDVSGYVQTDVLGGTLTASARYGYPALLLSIFAPQVSLAYWDYQLRYVLPLSAAGRQRFELVALGSYDSFSQREEPDRGLRVMFHRLEPRYVYTSAQRELGAALTLGWEESKLGDGFALQGAKILPRIWFEQRLGSSSRLRLSADAQGVWGGQTSAHVDRDLSRELGITSAGSGMRSVVGAQAELQLRPMHWLELQLGARIDSWLRADGSTFAFDPRLRVIFHASEQLDFHLAGGMVHQPAVAYFPVPGLADFADTRELQSALQAEAGVGWDVLRDLHAELQLYVHRYRDLIFADTGMLVNQLERACNDQGRDCRDMLDRRTGGYSYGAELFLRRPITNALSGFVSYTLAWASLDRVAGLPYTPSWDVRHLANLVLQWRIGSGFSVGVRGFFRSGKPDGGYYLTTVDGSPQLARKEVRLPGFMRVDLEGAYAWTTSWGRMRFAVEWFNATIDREPQDGGCQADPFMCQTQYAPAIFFPNLSLRAEH